MMFKNRKDKDRKTMPEQNENIIKNRNFKKEP